MTECNKSLMFYENQYSLDDYISYETKQPIFSISNPLITKMLCIYRKLNNQK